MSEHSSPEERTEVPTDKRMGQLRKSGAIHMSNEVVMVLTLMAGYYMVRFMWPGIMSDVTMVFRHSFAMIARADEPMSVQDLRNGFLGLVWILTPNLISITIVIALIATLGVMLQTNWNVKEHKIQFRWKLLNPLEGIKRIVSIRNWVNTLKGVAKLACILPIGYFVLKGYAPQMIQLIHFSIPSIIEFSAEAMSTVFWRVLYILIPLAIFDFFYGKYQWGRQNRMTKEEVKDERKAVEGDESTKRAIIRKGFKRIMDRIMRNVPKADVIVTNPTHYSIAIKYDRNRMNAPIVVAKGKGFLALRIREIAKENKIPILERKMLARALFASVEVGNEIPRELFKAVAEVLAYVYRIKNPFRKNVTETKPSQTSETRR